MLAEIALSPNFKIRKLKPEREGSPQGDPRSI